MGLWFQLARSAGVATHDDPVDLSEIEMRKWTEERLDRQRQRQHVFVGFQNLALFGRGRAGSGG
jgi:hypothetical protein